MSAKINQFRPTFTLQDIDTIILALKKDVDSGESARVCKYLELYRFKATLGINGPSYVKQVKPTVESSLGFTPSNPETIRASATEYRNKIELKASVAPELMTPTERYDFLANKVLDGTITDEERKEGEELEFALFSMAMGTFAQTEINLNSESKEN